MSSGSRVEGPITVGILIARSITCHLDRGRSTLCWRPPSFASTPPLLPSTPPSFALSLLSHLPCYSLLSLPLPATPFPCSLMTGRHSCWREFFIGHWCCLGSYVSVGEHKTAARGAAPSHRSMTTPYGHSRLELAGLRSTATTHTPARAHCGVNDWCPLCVPSKPARHRQLALQHRRAALVPCRDHRGPRGRRRLLLSSLSTLPPPRWTSCLSHTTSLSTPATPPPRLARRVVQLSLVQHSTVRRRSSCSRGFSPGASSLDPSEMATSFMKSFRISPSM